MEVTVEDWLAPSVVRWPDDVAGPWEVTMRWRAAADRAECVGLDVSAVDPETSKPVTATLMRALPVAGLIAVARKQRYESEGGDVVDAINDGQDIDVSPWVVEEMRQTSAPWQPQRPGRPVDLTAEFYAEVAATYSDAVAAGAAPLRAVEKAFTTTRPTASRWIASARRLGLLPATQKGRARGADVGPAKKGEGS